MDSIFVLFLTLVFISKAIFHGYYLLNFLQLEEYQNDRFLKWGLKNYQKSVPFLELLVIPLILAIRPLLNDFPMVLILTALIPIAIWSFEIYRIKRQKEKIVKPLVATSRAVRIMLAYGLVILLLSLTVLYFGLYRSPFPIGSSFVWITCSLILIGQLAAAYMVLANVILSPVEFAVQAWYINSAKKILEKNNPLVVGITGSYGKSTTKEITGHILSKKFNVLKTPRSFNTIMGICKVINNDLKPYHQIFIVEMGAYKRNEITRICKLVKPKIGVITAIGPQHLERFKTLENIIKAKNELMEALPEDGIGLFNADDENCLELSKAAKLKKTIRYGMNDQEGIDLLASDIRMNDQGTAFQVSMGRSGNKIQARIKLLGRHNVSNALAAIGIAVECGMALEDAVSALKSMEQFEHRLQVKKTSKLTIIDDAYNSNPSGARQAIEVLNKIEGSRKILITPGFVELGKYQGEAHKNFGMQAGSVCDLICLVSRPESVSQIMDGIKASGMPLENVHCFDSFEKAMGFVQKHSAPGDVLLIENDLTDNYL